jgi:endonuclease G, mitochondrial
MKKIFNTTIVAIIVFWLYVLVSAITQPAAAFEYNDQYVTPNCPLGCPEVDTDNLMVFERLYTLSLNKKSKFADWVAYEVDPRNFGPSPARVWKNNPLINPDWVLEPSDYKGVGNTGNDRGHADPLASFAGSMYWPTMNYLSNITPQSKELNRGPWKFLEEAVRDNSSYGNTLFVITGPIVSKSNGKVLTHANETYKMPVMYWKVVYNYHSYAAFLYNQEVDMDSPFCEGRLTIGNLNKTLQNNGLKLPSELLKLDNSLVLNKCFK